MAEMKAVVIYEAAETRRADEELRILAAVKLPLSEKWVLKSRFLGTSSSGSALFS
jgi:hypothetical protein